MSDDEFLANVTGLPVVVGLGVHGLRPCVRAGLHDHSGAQAAPRQPARIAAPDFPVLKRTGCFLV
jgi:hypothetical protein